MFTDLNKCYRRGIQNWATHKDSRTDRTVVHLYEQLIFLPKLKLPTTIFLSEQ